MLDSIYYDACARWSFREQGRALGPGYDIRSAQVVPSTGVWRGMELTCRYEAHRGRGEEFHVEIMHPDHTHSNYDVLNNGDLGLFVKITHRDAIDPRITVSLPQHPQIRRMYLKPFGDESVLTEGLIYREYRSLQNQTVMKWRVPICFGIRTVEEYRLREQRGFIAERDIMPFLLRLLDRQGLSNRPVIAEA